MEIHENDPPREYQCGYGPPVTIKDCARIKLEADEQVTFVTPRAGEYDLTRKAWGFYATPSLNGRLPRFGLSPTLVRNRAGQYFVLLVEQGEEAAFESYLNDEGLVVVALLDDQNLQRFEASLSGDHEQVMVASRSPGGAANRDDVC